MFPRIKKSKSRGKTYEYLVVSETTYKKGKGNTTEDIIQLGNVQKFKKEDIEGIIDGFIKIFELETYSVSEDVEIVESLEHGSIIFWQKIWDMMGLSKTIAARVKKRDKRIELKVDKYIQMMTINRCVDPLSKLGVTRWYHTTSYKELEGFSDLGLDATYFYRSMDQLLKVKDQVELDVYNKLKNLFSINVKLTFYDITSTFFYAGNCPMSAAGYSRDRRPDRKQIVIGVVTSDEGYPIKHYVFCGNVKDEKTVEEVVDGLKDDFNIEETIFVGDRGMITKLNLSKIAGNGFDYIMGVKARQDEICGMLFLDDDIDGAEHEEYDGLKIREKRVWVKDFLLWKIKKILKDNEIKIIDNEYKLFEKEIRNLTNKDEVVYKIFKPVIMNAAEKIEDKISYKIFNLIKKYAGEYEDELRYVICLNEVIKKTARKTREDKIKKISEELNEIFSSNKKKKEAVDIEKSINKIFEGYRSKYRKFFNMVREEGTKKATGYTKLGQVIEREKRMDGVFVLLTDRFDLEMRKVVESYKNLKEVESLFDDLKNFVDIRPVRHWLEIRVRAHVFVCILALLLKRIFEINYLKGKSVTEPLEEISKTKLVKYKIKFSKREDRRKEMLKVTNITPLQKKYFTMIGLKNPMSLEKFRVANQKS